MAELGLSGVTLTFGGHPLLDGIDLEIERGERIGLLGRNGAGKSTLLRVLTGELEIDDGVITKRPGLRVAGLPQEVPDDMPGTVADILHGALAELGLEDWERNERVTRTVTAFGLNADEQVGPLSAGSKRRVLLARAFALEPDLLILDEPTNHLDVLAIERLELQLLGPKTTLVFVTHDRAFLRRIATRILDLDRGRLASYSCDYATYLDRRAAELEAEASQDAAFDKLLSKEEAWLKRGVKARRTRNQGRVRALKALREERAQRRDRTGQVRATLQESDRTGQLVLRTKKLSKAFGDTTIVKDLDFEVMRGDRIGLIGPNGCGKTTLIRLLLGELEPDSGEVREGTKLEVARFDQLHGQLDPNKTVVENVCDHADTVTIGNRSRHVLGYLQDFLFSPEQARGPITKLSGGERNRLQLARLLAKPCNVLVLDEPTNDLDLETLDLLEGLLFDFQGTLILVSHDREFLDNVVTSSLVFEPGGGVREQIGAVDWTSLRPVEAAPKKVAKSAVAPAPKVDPTVRKRTYAEQLELDKLPETLERLESDKSKLEAAMGDPGFYQRPGHQIAQDNAQFEALTTELDAAYARWELLEELRG
tara:strand:+ start:8817 stop:10598 length:1782 start_codon:yes stop_codon:yes gene_type:complete